MQHRCQLRNCLFHKDKIRSRTLALANETNGERLVADWCDVDAGSGVQ